jgi:hypothetical protein
MFRTPDQELQTTQAELKATQAELAELKEQLRQFEAQVDARLGNLLDQLSDLNVETSHLDERLRRIREERLFGSDLMQYLDGAPLPARPGKLDNLPPSGLPLRKSAGLPGAGSDPSSMPDLPDIKVLYRKLARRYHPDLARSDADRALSNDQMKQINQAYGVGDLATLMRLAGMSIPYGVDISLNVAKPEGLPRISMSEIEQARYDLREARQQLSRLSSLPIVKLSLDVKLARHQGRDLLHEMTGELQYKIARKTAERDYLQSQINAAEEKKLGG